MRLIWPSAKMHTTSPALRQAVAVCRDLIRSRGPPSALIGMALESTAKGFAHHFSYMPRSMMKRTGRRVEVMTKQASASDR